MLQLIRDKLTGWIAVVIFIFIGLAFALWGIDLGGANLNYAAKVNGEDISLNDFRRQTQNQLSQYAQFYTDGVPPEVEDRLRDNVLQGMIREQLVSQRARDLGYRVGDLVIASAIQSIPAFQVDGEFSMDLYRGRLRSQGETPTSFEAMMRSSLRNQQLQQGLAASAFVTEQELARFVALQDQQRELGWLVIPASAFMDESSVSEEAIRAEYENNPEAYQSPETVAIEYVLLPRVDAAGEIEISEQELQEYFESEKAIGRFGGVEERRASHILVAVSDERDDAAARAAAEAVLERIRAGEDFATLAKELSDDPGSGASGGDLGFAEPDIYAPAFRDAIVGAQPGELLGPVRTQFGYHVIRLEEIRDPGDKSFAEVRDELTAELTASKSEAEFYERAEELRNAAFRAFNELESVAQDMELELQQLTGITRAAGPGLAASPEVREVAFSDPVLLDSENSDSIELDEGVAVLRVIDHQRATLRPIDEVRPQIIAKLARQEAEAGAAELGRELAEQSKMSGALPVDGLPEGTQVNERRLVRRNEAGLARDLLTAAFQAPAPDDRPAVDGLQLANGDYAVYAVHTIKPGDVSALTAEERDQRRQQLVRLNGNLELAAYIDRLRREASIRINEEQLN